MADIARVPDAPNPSGIEPTVLQALDVDDTQIFPNKSGNVLLRVFNGGGSSTTVTIVTPGDVSGNEIDDTAVPVGAGKAKYIGPFDPSVFNDHEGNIAVVLSKTESVAIEAVRVRL